MNSITDPPTLDVAAYTDAQYMRAVFEAQLPDVAQANLAVIRCTILSARYRRYTEPAQSSKIRLAVAYLLELRDRSTQAETTRIVYAKAYPGERSCHELDTAVPGPLDAAGAGSALTYLPRLGMLVWSFPNDPSLPQLPELVDPRLVMAQLPYQQLPGIDGPGDIAKVAVEVLRYRPESRCSIRYRLHTGPAHRPRSLALFGKTFNDTRGQGIDQLMRYLWQRWYEDRDCFVVAQPLAYNDAVRTVWQSALAGTPALEVLERQPEQQLPAAIAKGLARLHQSELAPASHTTPEHKLREVRKKSAKLIQALPELRAELQPLVQRLEDELALLDAPRTPIHGDFDIQQLQLEDGRLVLFDFDDVAIGDPAQDLANFMVDLYFHAFSYRDARRIGAQLLEAYRAQVRWELPRARLSWHIRAQLLSKAYWFLQHQKPDFREAIRRTLMLARSGVELDTGGQR